MNKIRKISTLSFLTIVSLGITGCASYTPKSLYPLSSPQNLDSKYLSAPGASVKDTIRTAKSGDILLRQGVQSSAVFELENSPVPTHVIGKKDSRITYNFNKGDKYILTTDGSSAFLCSIGRPRVLNSMIGDGSFAMRACFKLDPSQSKLDLDNINNRARTYTSSEAFVSFDTGNVTIAEASLRNTSGFERLTYLPGNGTEVLPTAEFRKVDPSLSGLDPAEIGLRYIYNNDGGQLESVYIDNGQYPKFDNDPKTINADKGFPQTIEMGGSKVEVLAITNEVLAYRVLSGFDSNKAFLTDFSPK